MNFSSERRWGTYVPRFFTMYICEKNSAGLPVLKRVLTVSEGQILTTPDCVVDFLESREVLRPSRQMDEHFYTLCIRGESLVGIFISTGSMDACVAQTREIFRNALLCGATSIICAHNHPGGTLKPSAQDRDVTRALADAGKLLCIPLKDHIIIGDTGSYYSFKREGML